MAEEMKNEETKTEKGAAKLNVKAEKFRDFLEDNNINVFSTEILEDDLKSAVFRSRIEVSGQQLPMAVIIDESVFTIIRTQVITGVDVEKQVKVVEFINEINEKFKIFKYYLTADGGLFLDVCIPFVDETFDSNMIHLMLDVLVRHLTETYPQFMQKVWGA